MRKKTRYLLILLLFTASCSSLPEILSENKNPFTDNSFREKAFLRENWLLTHSIELTLPTGSRGYTIGISKLDPRKMRIETVMLSLEGLVVFQSVYQNSMEIIKAVPPMDSKEFGKGLINDIKLIFFPPDYRDIRSGKLSDGSGIYRYSGRRGTVDIIFFNDRTIIKKKYDRNNSLLRIVKLENINSKGIARSIEIKKPGLTGYTLNLKLLKSEKY